jgi:sugar phosphate isomerase/epimerase
MMNNMNRSRRSFLLGSAAVAGTLWTNTHFARAAGMSRYPFGIQLSTVDKPLHKDVPGTLKALYDIGFRAVETAGFSNLSAKAFRHALDRAGLRCSSCHFEFEGVEWGPQFDEAHTVGAEYVVSSILVDFTGAKTDEEVLARIEAIDLDGFKRIIDRATRMGEAAARAGLKYAYHNHNFEFRRFDGAHRGYDLLLEQTDEKLVSLEIDCGWMSLAGADPVEYLKAHGRRIRMLHLKDYVKEAAPSTRVGGHQGTELGRGFIDYGPILAAAKRAGVEHCFLEQEPPFVGAGPLEAVKISARYLNDLKQ